MPIYACWIFRTPHPDGSKTFFVAVIFKNEEVHKEQYTSALSIFDMGPKNTGHRLAIMDMQAILANLLLQIQLASALDTPS